MRAAQTIADTSCDQLRTTSSATELAARLRAARERTLAFAGDLTCDQLLGPNLPIVNPPLWEIAHVGWFQEYWCLRYRDGITWKESSIPHADARYNSATFAHHDRWT